MIVVMRGSVVAVSNEPRPSADDRFATGVSRRTLSASTALSTEVALEVTMVASI